MYCMLSSISQRLTDAECDDRERDMKCCFYPLLFYVSPSLRIIKYPSSREIIAEIGERERMKIVIVTSIRERERGMNEDIERGGRNITIVTVHEERDGNGIIFPPSD